MEVAAHNSYSAADYIFSGFAAIGKALEFKY